MTGTRIALVAGGAAALVLALGACSNDPNDLEGVPEMKPSKAEIYRNVEGHPDLVRLCIDKEAFVTVGDDAAAVVPVPGWNAWCS